MRRRDAVLLLVAASFFVLAGSWAWRNRDVDGDFGAPSSAVQPATEGMISNDASSGKKREKTAPPPARVPENIG